MLIGPSDHLVIEPFKTSLCSVDGVVGSDVDVPILVRLSSKYRMTCATAPQKPTDFCRISLN